MYNSHSSGSRSKIAMQLTKQNRINMGICVKLLLGKNIEISREGKEKEKHMRKAYGNRKKNSTRESE